LKKLTLSPALTQGVQIVDRIPILGLHVANRSHMLEHELLEPVVDFHMPIVPPKWQYFPAMVWGMPYNMMQTCLDSKEIPFDLLLECRQVSSTVFQLMFECTHRSLIAIIDSGSLVRIA
jgi:hypothetical protein